MLPIPCSWLTERLERKLPLPALANEEESTHREKLNCVPLPLVNRMTQLRPIEIVQSYSSIFTVPLTQRQTWFNNLQYIAPDWLHFAANVTQNSKSQNHSYILCHSLIKWKCPDVIKILPKSKDLFFQGVAVTYLIPWHIIIIIKYNPVDCLYIYSYNANMNCW